MKKYLVSSFLLVISFSNFLVAASLGSPLRWQHDPYAWGRQFTKGKTFVEPLAAAACGAPPCYNDHASLHSSFVLPGFYDLMIIGKDHRRPYAERIDVLNQIIARQYAQNSKQQFMVYITLAKIPHDGDVNAAKEALNIARQINKSSYICQALIALALRKCPEQKDRVTQAEQYICSYVDEAGNGIVGDGTPRQIFEVILISARTDWRTDAEKDNNSIDGIRIQKVSRLLNYLESECFRAFRLKKNLFTDTIKAYCAAMVVPGFPDREFYAQEAYRIACRERHLRYLEYIRGVACGEGWSLPGVNFRN